MDVLFRINAFFSAVAGVLFGLFCLNRMPIIANVITFLRFTQSTWFKYLLIFVLLLVVLLALIQTLLELRRLDCNTNK